MIRTRTYAQKLAMELAAAEMSAERATTPHNIQVSVDAMQAVREKAVRQGMDIQKISQITGEIKTRWG